MPCGYSCSPYYLLNLIKQAYHKAPEDIDSWDQKEGWRGIESLVEEIEALGRRSLAVTADISNSGEVTAMVEKTVQEFGKIDILVNNAGILLKHVGVIPVVELSEEAWNKSIAVNLTGAFLMCKAVAKQMIKQGQGGKIINISSVAGKRGAAGNSWYSASKFGVHGLSQSLAHELAPHKINVNVVCPGLTVTWGSLGQKIHDAMSQGLSEEEAITEAYGARRLKRIPLGRAGTVEDVVNVVAFLASDESSYMTGQAINVAGGSMMIH